VVTLLAAMVRSAQSVHHTGFFHRSWWLWNDPTWGQAEAWAVLILLLPSLICLVHNLIVKGLARRTRGATPTTWHFFTRLITGENGSWSTSKAGYLIWTYAFLYAGLASIIEYKSIDNFFGQLKAEYLVVLGIPAAAAFGAKALANRADPKPAGSQQGGSLAPAQSNVGTGLAQLVTDDDGDTALHKFQYFSFNLLLVLYFLVKFMGNEIGGLPDLPDTFVGLTGVSAAAYLAQKGLSPSGSGAAIATVDPPSAHVDDPIRIFGKGLVSPSNQTVSVLIADLAAYDVSVAPGDPTVVNAKVPKSVAGKGAVKVKVVAYDGTISNELDFTVIA
jgi:hypothetical protein